MNSECWCVDFSLNGELQGATDFFDTEEEAVKYCLKKANIDIEDCRGRRYHFNGVWWNADTRASSPRAERRPGSHPGIPTS